jgi:hypothetical protein
VNAACLSGHVRLTSWIPAQGYQTDGYAPGPGATAWVMFKSSASELTITATCAHGKPSFTTAPDIRGGGGADRHGGGVRSQHLDRHRPPQQKIHCAPDLATPARSHRCIQTVPPRQQCP